MEIAVQILTLLLAGYFCWLIGTWRDIDPDNKQLMDRFVRLALVLGVALVGTAAAKVFGPVGLAAAVVVTILVAFQIGLLRVAGGVTLMRELTSEIVEAKKKYLALAAILITAPVLLWSGSNPLRDQIMVYIIEAELVVVSVLFLTRTGRLFVRQKVSLLIWFLYLCAVEIFPVGLAIVLAAKNA